MGTKLCIRYCRIPAGQRGRTAYPGGSRGRNGGRPDSAIMGVWVSERCGSDGKIIANKQTLFQRALQRDSTEIEITDEKINFTCFPYIADGDEIAA